ncbi:TIR domain-containing protein [Gemmiger qucibialis]|jgi:uncharacterized membrane protein|uniref:hypothetical protein n=1 Tax=Gemmiger qucibialis TaxID=2997294 RepID=UPI0022E8892A|nr:hypothetical protein [Gemmiger qucibialis]
MYTKFNYSPSIYFYNSTLNSHMATGCSLYAKHEKEVHECLDRYISDDGIIDGTALKNYWFSISPKDVFISHSHKDINKVKAFAGWLYNCFGLKAFIDSCSWEYCDELLNKIDKKYCYNPKTKTYDYNLRNYTTSHVHMMLSTALTEMMNKTECVIFFNTPNSISMTEALSKIKDNPKEKRTTSPWIYYELSMTTMLQITEPTQREIIKHFAQDERSMPTISYNVEKALNEMPTLTDEQLAQWENSVSSKYPVETRMALDKLYEIVFPK